tara:strand:+ start:504 stop:2504 length:2001 start_codon:yes stop_codon:yes gene_type:complete
MAYIKINTFGGLAPRTSPRLLRDDLATVASDVNLESGRLVPVKDNSDTLTLSNSSRQSVFKYTDSPERWLQFDEKVDVVRSPIPGETNDTIYWSGQSFPRMGRSSNVTHASNPMPNSFFRLGIPAPTAAPTVAPVAVRSFDGVIDFVNESSTITITTNASGSATAHSATAGEFITLVGFSTTAGVSAENINGTFKIKTVPSTSTLTVELSAAATSTATSGSVANGAKFGDNSDAEIDYETSYVYTFVSAYGEEGPPSPASTVITTDDNMTVALSNLETSTTKSNVNFGTGAKKRIYRSNTGSNTTQFQFVGEVSMATTTFTDSSKNSELAEVIPSTTWIAPPDDDTALYPDGPMQGLIPIQNGILAGFTGNRICFSEPYQPHAWPADYRIGIEEPIVGIKATSNGVVVTTTSTPYLVTGSDPSAMVAIKIETAEKCMNRRSMVDMGQYVIYASPDGLIAVTGATAQNLTERLITPAQWQADYYPNTIEGFYWQGRYVGFFNTGSGFGGFIFDPRDDGTLALTNLEASALIRGGFTDPDDNELYLIIGNKLKKFQGSNTNLSYNWKSKEFYTPRPISFGFAKIDAEAYPVSFKVYGDGNVIYHATISTSGDAFSVTGSTPSFSATSISDTMVRLPASVHTKFAIEILADKVVNEVCIGENIAELKEA